MNEEQMDVEGQSSEPTQEVQSSAETENTSEFEFPKENPGWPEGVYERFKGVNEKKKELEARLNELSEKYKPFEENSDKYSIYEQFDSVLSQNPQLYDAIKAAWNQGLGLDQMTPDQLQALQMAQALQTTNGALSQMVIGNYQRDFEGWYKDTGYPEDSKQAVLGVAQNILSQMNPNWQLSYNQEVVGKVLSEVKRQVDAFRKANMSSYIQEKKQTVPQSVSRGSSHGQGTKRFPSREEFVEQLRQMGNLPVI